MNIVTASIKSPNIFLVNHCITWRNVSFLF